MRNRLCLRNSRICLWTTDAVEWLLPDFENAKSCVLLRGSWLHHDARVLCAEVKRGPRGVRSRPRASGLRLFVRQFQLPVLLECRHYFHPALSWVDTTVCSQGGASTWARAPVPHFARSLLDGLLWKISRYLPKHLRKCRLVITFILKKEKKNGIL